MTFAPGAHAQAELFKLREDGTCLRLRTQTIADVGREAARDLGLKGPWAGRSAPGRRAPSPGAPTPFRSLMRRRRAAERSVGAPAASVLVDVPAPGDLDPPAQAAFCQRLRPQALDASPRLGCAKA